MLFVVQGSELGLTMVTAEVTYGLKQARYIFVRKSREEKNNNSFDFLNSFAVLSVRRLVAPFSLEMAWI